MTPWTDPSCLVSRSHGSTSGSAFGKAAVDKRAAPTVARIQIVIPGFELLDLGGPLDGRAALGRAMASFVRHMLGFEIEIAPLPRIDTPEFDWFIGLDPDATRIGNAMWQGAEVPEAQQLLALYRAVPAEDAPVLPQMQGKPIYLMLAANAEGRVRMKPQNLLLSLPLRDKP